MLSIKRTLILLVLLALGFISSNSDLLRSPSVVGACGKCGDGYCNPRCGETAKSCPADCGGTVE